MRPTAAITVSQRETNGWTRAWRIREKLAVLRFDIWPECRGQRRSELDRIKPVKSNDYAYSIRHFVIVAKVNEYHGEEVIERRVAYFFLNYWMT